MSKNHMRGLTHWTKLLLFIMIVVSTKLESDVFIYATTIIWLEVGWFVRQERRLIDWINNRLK